MLKQIGTRMEFTQALKNCALYPLERENETNCETDTEMQTK